MFYIECKYPEIILFAEQKLSRKIIFIQVEKQIERKQSVKSLVNISLGALQEIMFLMSEVKTIY